MCMKITLRAKEKNVYKIPYGRVRKEEAGRIKWGLKEQYTYETILNSF